MLPRPMPRSKPAPDPAARRRALLALALLVPAPSLGAFAALVAPRGAVGQAVYAACKLWLLAFPLVWLLMVERGRPSLSPLPRGRAGRALAEGVLLGLILGGGLLAIDTLLGERLLDREHLRQAARASGFARSQAVFLGFALYLALVNALLEEYVWRWFVQRRCEKLAPRAAVPLAALLFTLHHALAFGVQFAGALALLASLAVFAAACVWSWLYARWRSVWPAYVSHVLVDAAALWIGWRVLFPG